MPGESAEREKVLTQYKAVLIYSSSSSDFQKTVDKTRENAMANDYSFEPIDSISLTESHEQRFLDDIRITSPQTRGQVKSAGGGGALPITHRGKLNRRIPILILYRDFRPTNVFPHKFQGAIRTLSRAFENREENTALSIEDNIAAILGSKPEMLGARLEPVDKQVNAGAGVVDLLFKDPNGVHVLVELKEAADQETVGQVLKQSNGMKHKIGAGPIRKAIVALRTSGKVVEACKAAEIELYIISAERRA